MQKCICSFKCNARVIFCCDSYEDSSNQLIDEASSSNQLIEEVPWLGEEIEVER